MKKIFWYVWQTDIRTGKRECAGVFDNLEDAQDRCEWYINSDCEMHQWFRYTYTINEVDMDELCKRVQEGVTA